MSGHQAWGGLDCQPQQPGLSKVSGSASKYAPYNLQRTSLAQSTRATSGVSAAGADACDPAAAAAVAVAADAGGSRGMLPMTCPTSA